MRVPAEIRDRAVLLVFDHQDEYGSQWAAIGSIAEKVGCSHKASMRPSTEVVVRIVDHHRGQYGVELICAVAPIGDIRPPSGTFPYRAAGV